MRGRGLESGRFSEGIAPLGEPLDCGVLSEYRRREHGEGVGGDLPDTRELSVASWFVCFAALSADRYAIYELLNSRSRRALFRLLGHCDFFPCQQAPGAGVHVGTREVTRNLSSPRVALEEGGDVGDVGVLR